MTVFRVPTLAGLCTKKKVAVLIHTRLQPGDRESKE